MTGVREEKKRTLKDLCDMVVAKGECTQSLKVKVYGKELYVCIDDCPKLEGFMYEAISQKPLYRLLHLLSKNKCQRNQ